MPWSEAYNKWLSGISWAIVIHLVVCLSVYPQSLGKHQVFP
jgi:hypothetical protein